MEAALNHNNIYIVALENIQENKPCILATVVDKHGSTPQIPGCSAIFGKDGLVAGTVGGGLVEHHIQNKAIEALQTKQSQIYRYELNDDISEEDSVICGGGMTILLDAFPEKNNTTFELMQKSLSNREPGVLVTLCGSDKSNKIIVTRKWVTAKDLSSVAEKITDDIKNAIVEMLDKPKNGDFREIVVHTSPETEDNFTFLESIIPLPKLIIAGAGHVGNALSHLGKLLDFEVTVWDDREEYANKKNLPDADTILTGNIGKSLGKLKPERDTFVVIVTRGHKNDAEILKHFIKSEAAYIGMIGSRNKVAQVKEKFIKEGWATTEEWAKIYAPVGLKIGSKTVEEIAISIAAQLVQVRYGLNSENG